MKLNFIMSVLVIFLISGCTEASPKVTEQNVNKYNEEESNKMEIDNDVLKIESSNETERIFIDLTYLGNMNNTGYRMHYIELEPHPDDEFTWWNHYTVEQYYSLSEYYNFDLLDKVDKAKQDIIISFGRKLSYLYYYKKDYLIDQEWQLAGYCAKPVFEKDYVHNSAYVYVINKVDLIDSELASHDMDSFLAGDVPFELPPIEDELNENKWFEF